MTWRLQKTSWQHLCDSRSSKRSLRQLLLQLLLPLLMRRMRMKQR